MSDDINLIIPSKYAMSRRLLRDESTVTRNDLTEGGVRIYHELPHAIALQIWVRKDKTDEFSHVSLRASDWQAIIAYVTKTLPEITEEKSRD